MITDASWGDVGVPGVAGRIAFILMDQVRSLRVGGTFDVLDGSPLLVDLETRKTQIMACEALAPIMALCLCRHRLANKSINFFIDNMSGLCALAKGSSKKPDLSAMCFAFHLAANSIGVKPWIDYVQTSSNVADGGSRVGPTDALSAELGIKLVWIPTFHLPLGFATIDPPGWAAWWDTTAAWAADFEKNIRCVK